MFPIQQLKEHNQNETFIKSQYNEITFSLVLVMENIYHETISLEYQAIRQKEQRAESNLTLYHYTFSMLLHENFPPIILFQLNVTSGVVVSFWPLKKKICLACLLILVEIINLINHRSHPRSLAGVKLLTDSVAARLGRPCTHQAC